MARNHAVQHRPSRESKQVERKNELQELRAQNQKLRRENARLRQKNTELYDREGVVDPIESNDDRSEQGPINPLECPNRCGVPLRHVQIPNKTLKVCTECLWRSTE